MGHEYVGWVEEAGSEVTAVKPGQFVVGSFATSDNTCADCQDRSASGRTSRPLPHTSHSEGIAVPESMP